jgi:glycosyltransferase involved in cell wall biosynthesis/GT2 family glycosyltransferase
MPLVSCLVISRTAALLNRLLISLPDSRENWNVKDEILCSWNGSPEDEELIQYEQGTSVDIQDLFRIVQRKDYHFASNMNQMAKVAKGEILVLLNDDLILDKGSLDHAINILMNHEKVGIVGANLRTSLGDISHAGLLFDQNFTAYNRFRPDDLRELLGSLESQAKQSCFVPAVTGAFMAVRREDFLDVRFRETFKVCGEDVALCLDLYRIKKKFSYYAASVTGVHDERSTRGYTPELEDTNLLSTLAKLIIPTEPELIELCRQRSSEEAHALWILVQSLRSQLATERTLASHLDDTLKAIRSSSSWKLTAPLRMVGDWQKGERPAATLKDIGIDLSVIQQEKDRITPGVAASDQPELLFDSLIFAQANRASVSRGGIYRYASELVAALRQDERMGQIVPFCADQLSTGSAIAELQALGAKNGIDLVGGQRPEKSFQRSMPQMPDALKEVLRPVHRRLVHSRWMQARAQQQITQHLKTLRPSQTVFHTPFQSVPEAIRDSSLRHIAVTVHDMLPRIHPEFFTAETVRQFNSLISQLRPTDHVICVSECTRNDFLRWQNTIPEDQVYVTPLAASSALQPINDEEVKADFKERLGMHPADRVVLSLCTLEPRKNLIRLIEAFEALHCKHKGGIKLVLVGSLGWKTSELDARLRDSVAAEAIIVTGHIADDQLATVYSIADVFAYPSLYEGFGLPPLEAMQCGVPVVVGHTSSLPEVVGDAALMVDPHSVHELSDALEKVLCDQSLANTLQSKSLTRAAAFSWQNTARQTINIYQRMIYASS